MNFSDTSIRKYYASRAPIYDRVYRIPERQEDLRYLENWIPTLFKEKKVVERIGVNADFRELEHFWIFQYETV